MLKRLLLISSLLFIGWPPYAQADHEGIPCVSPESLAIETVEVYGADKDYANLTNKMVVDTFVKNQNVPEHYLPIDQALVFYNPEYNMYGVYLFYRGCASAFAMVDVNPLPGAEI
jgi:hypothetical protein|tara:strand:+ start:4791 stop:5135 length:345 start_codon:yes stop_codon:yes gene_type:complete